jgi:hypothetical protein
MPSPAYSIVSVYALLLVSIAYELKTNRKNAGRSEPTLFWEEDISHIARIWGGHPIAGCRICGIGISSLRGRAFSGMEERHPDRSENGQQDATLSMTCGSGG